MITNGRAGYLTLLWQEYKLVGGNDLRNSLVEKYFPIAKYNAERVKAKLPASVELDDLISMAVLGLIEAIESFDLARGVKFETYCVPRIRGAIFDELRNIDWVPRLVRHRTKLYNKAISELSSKVNGHKPSLLEIAEYLGVSIKEAECIEKETDGAYLLQESKGYRGNGEDFKKRQLPLDQMPDMKMSQPLNEIIKEDGFEELIACLSDEDQIIFTLYYRQDFTMKKIGEILGMCESRISQKHDQAIKKIRDCLFVNGTSHTNNGETNGESP